MPGSWPGGLVSVAGCVPRKDLFSPRVCRILLKGFPMVGGHIVYGHRGITLSPVPHGARPENFAARAICATNLRASERAYADLLRIYRWQ